jgi:hypothetical protein
MKIIQILDDDQLHYINAGDDTNTPWNFGYSVGYIWTTIKNAFTWAASHQADNPILF